MQFPKIKFAIRREMDGLCTLCGEDIDSKPKDPHGMAHLDCIEEWFQDHMRKINAPVSD